MSEESRFAIRIIRLDGHPIYLRPGAQGERDLKSAILASVEARGVGFGRTTTHVLKDISDAIDECIMNLKSEVIPPTPVA